MFCTKQAVKLAKRELVLAIKECYLLLQSELLSSLRETKSEEEKKKWKKIIEETGENYQEWIKNYES